MLDLDPADVIVKATASSRAGCCSSTPSPGRIIGDDELKHALARPPALPALLDEQKVYLEDLPDREPSQPEPPELERLQRALRLHREDLAC